MLCVTDSGTCLRASEGGLAQGFMDAVNDHALMYAVDAESCLVHDDVPLMTSSPPFDKASNR